MTEQTISLIVCILYVSWYVTVIVKLCSISKSLKQLIKLNSTKLEQILDIYRKF